MYDSFGKLKRHGGKVKNTYTFTGREWDKEIGLYYYRARYYDSEAGRFVTPDPSHFIQPRGTSIPYHLLPFLLTTPQELNGYSYCQNDPVNLIDPLGLKEFEMRIWIGGSVGYAIVGGGVYDVTIMDVETGETTLYTVKVLGLGVGLPSFRGSSRPVRFKVDDPCKTSASFEGYGYMGGVSAEVVGGVKVGGGIKIPHGPFIPGPMIGWERGGFDIGVSHSITYWSH